MIAHPDQFFVGYYCRDLSGITLLTKRPNFSLMHLFELWQLCKNMGFLKYILSCLLTCNIHTGPGPKLLKNVLPNGPFLWCLPCLYCIITYSSFPFRDIIGNVKILWNPLCSRNCLHYPYNCFNAMILIRYQI